ncbi:uncharacterized protein [Drosophila virilis]|uniref:Uncharacterized protein n=1 Tax=Drosophila virilis TaxID=7244 RepID=B4M735_DROVI|nr:uncharacterized protein LOC6633712 [Drosophila virilis]EDW62602.1 uncharacterized protein Dvir_GJ16907 [Drosophila virilis]
MSQSPTSLSSQPERQPKRKRKHVVYSFQLEQHIHPLTKDLTVIACLPDGDLQSLEPINPQEERLYKMYICDTVGRLVKSIAFTESDYREVVNDFINSDCTDTDRNADAEENVAGNRDGHGNRKGTGGGDVSGKPGSQLAESSITLFMPYQQHIK